MIVVIESPFAGQVEKNKAYLQRCLRDSLYRGESPFASHSMYTEDLDDGLPHERTLGIRAGLAFYQKADLCAVYTDLGLSSGMKLGIDYAISRGIPVQYRSLLGTP